jgi:hypothetical protein
MPTLEERLAALEAKVDAHAMNASDLRGTLAGERRALAATLEAARAGAGPTERVALRVGDRHGRVVERGLDVGDADRNAPLGFLLGRAFRGGLFFAHETIPES